MAKKLKMSSEERIGNEIAMKDSYTRAGRTIGKTFPNGISVECDNKLRAAGSCSYRGDSQNQRTAGLEGNKWLQGTTQLPLQSMEFFAVIKRRSLIMVINNVVVLKYKVLRYTIRHLPV